ncbi:MAG TPA: Gfo/Idh/MocA family oxidoreductase [Micromonospora sp.]|nr:Gfo/Idh/MocA family oxidoreductase [Micromonospora sp.]
MTLNHSTPSSEPTPSPLTPSRRNVLRGATLGVALGLGGAAALPAAARAATTVDPTAAEPARGASEKSMANVPFEGFDEVRVGVIGLGNRGLGQLRRFAAVSRITALADIRPARVQSAVNSVLAEGNQTEEPARYTNGEEDYLNLVARDDIDLIYIATPWEWHHPQAKAAMEHGKHVVVELPIATSLHDIWDLVKTSERTRKHCILLENVAYFRPELRVLNMVKQGLFGDVVHGSGGYIHDLKNPYLFHGAYYPEDWRRAWQTKMNAAHYPMHGLAPIAAAMDINRGDRFTEMVSVATPALGLSLYREERTPSTHPSWQDDEYISGDRTTILITTAQGRTIRVEHDVNTPHPYSRAGTLVGTRGAWSEDRGIYLETLGHTNHSWRTFGDAFREHDHWLWQDIGSSAEHYGGHGGGDFINIFRTIQLMRLGLTPDIDVYDSAAWCSIIPLSAESMKTRSLKPVKIPDFTRGHWQNPRPGLERGRPS